jgi:hypothetical protein
MAFTRRFLSTLTSKVEIERKFLPTRLLLDALTRPTTALQNLPSSIRVAHTHPGAIRFIRDVYYDRYDGRLTAEGLWVRRRSVVVGSPTSSSTSSSSTSSWEAKVRVGGDFIATQFVEVEGAQAVEREIYRALGGVHVTVDKITEHLGVMCDLTTRRVEGRLEICYEDEDDDDNDVDKDARLQNLTVAIDQVVETPSGDFAAARAVLERMLAGHTRGRDEGSTSTIHTDSSPDLFFHEVGELEMMAEVRTEAPVHGENYLSKSVESERRAHSHSHSHAHAHSQSHSHQHSHEDKRKIVASARAAQLEAFMCAHPALFPMTPRPCGKLNAYFAWKEAKAGR